MLRVKNAVVVEMFLRGEQAKNHSESLTSTGKKLYSYNTVIAQWHNGHLFINETKYSQTTSTIQNMLKRQVFNYIPVRNCRMNIRDITA